MTLDMDMTQHDELCLEVLHASSLFVYQLQALVLSPLDRRPPEAARALVQEAWHWLWRLGVLTQEEASREPELAVRGRSIVIGDRSPPTGHLPDRF